MKKFTNGLLPNRFYQTRQSHMGFGKMVASLMAGLISIGAQAQTLTPEERVKYTSSIEVGDDSGKIHHFFEHSPQASTKMRQLLADPRLEATGLRGFLRVASQSDSTIKKMEMDSKAEFQNWGMNLKTIHSSYTFSFNGDYYLSGGYSPPAEYAKGGYSFMTIEQRFVWSTEVQCRIEDRDSFARRLAAQLRVGGPKITFKSTDKVSKVSYWDVTDSISRSIHKSAHKGKFSVQQSDLEEVFAGSIEGSLWEKTRIATAANRVCTNMIKGLPESQDVPDQFQPKKTPTPEEGGDTESSSSDSNADRCKTEETKTESQQAD